jgi:hypothetical protein
MPSFIIIEKSGSLKNAKTTDLVDLYKKCGFKNNDGFSLAHNWSVEFNDTEYKLEIYGKVTGRANTENKYEFPPPIDNVLFFGSCAAVLYVNNKMTDMGSQEFKDIMDHLYGGYSDIGGSDEEEDEDEEDDIDLPKTKHGYVKDDFVVSSDAEDDDDNGSDEEEELIESDEEIKPIKKKKPPVKKVTTTNKVVTNKVATDKKPKKPKLKEPKEPVYIEMTEELTEDAYLE